MAPNMRALVAVLAFGLPCALCQTDDAPDVEKLAEIGFEVVADKELPQGLAGVNLLESTMADNAEDCATLCQDEDDCAVATYLGGVDDNPAEENCLLKSVNLDSCEVPDGSADLEGAFLLIKKPEACESLMLDGMNIASGMEPMEGPMEAAPPVETMGPIAAGTVEDMGPAAAGVAPVEVGTDPVVGTPSDALAPSEGPAAARDVGTGAGDEAGATGGAAGVFGSMAAAVALGVGMMLV